MMSGEIKDLDINGLDFPLAVTAAAGASDHIELTDGVKIKLSLLIPNEDDKDKSVWFLDHDYLENMYGMFKKVNGKTAESNICVKLIAVEIK